LGLLRHRRKPKIPADASATNAVITNEIGADASKGFFAVFGRIAAETRKKLARRVRTTTTKIFLTVNNLLVATDSLRIILTCTVPATKLMKNHKTPSSVLFSAKFKTPIHKPKNTRSKISTSCGLIFLIGIP